LDFWIFFFVCNIVGPVLYANPSMQMNAGFQEEQIGTPFVWLRAPGGGGGGGRGQGPPNHF